MGQAMEFPVLEGIEMVPGTVHLVDCKPLTSPPSLKRLPDLQSGRNIDTQTARRLQTRHPPCPTAHERSRRSTQLAAVTERVPFLAADNMGDTGFCVGQLERPCVESAGRGLEYYDRRVEHHVCSLLHISGLRVHNASTNVDEDRTTASLHTRNAVESYWLHIGWNPDQCHDVLHCQHLDRFRCRTGRFFGPNIYDGHIFRA